MRGLFRLFWMALVLLVVALLSALTAMRFAIHGREVSIPDLRGKTPSEARRLAEDAGLAVAVERSYYSPTVPEGRVLSQMPTPGTTVRPGWEVRLALSLGPQRVAIPQVVGDSERAAAITIAQRRLELGPTASIQIPGIDPGQVMGQNPPANATDVSAPKISLLVSQATQPQAFVMPTFIGQPLGSVTGTLKSAGFAVGRVTVAPLDSGAAPENTASPAEASPVTAASPASIIVAQDPVPGAKVSAGSAINFVVK
jgi:eukaryotic-like serine/threonine-protein kinase